MSSNANNTTSGDNSSDSASNKNNNTTKSQLEIVEQKLKKCSNEIETLRKRYESKLINFIYYYYYYYNF